MVGVQKRKIRWAISLFLVMLYFSCLTVQAQYGGGTGEPNDPYLIYTAEQMNEIGLYEEDWDKHFKLMADIDLAQYTDTQFNIIGYWQTWQDHKPFTGVFDGNGKKISNFNYTSIGPNGTKRIGLFGWVEHAEVKNLKLVDPNITVEEAFCVGAMIGKAQRATIMGCCVEGGNISGERNIGGLIGECDNTVISSCYSAITVQGYNNIGGFAGWANDTTFSQCHSSSVVTGQSYVGGLLGNGSGQIIDSCYSEGNVSGQRNIGGLLGRNYATLISCYSMARVSSTNENAGGLVGYNERDIISCRASGNVEGRNFVGGLVGANNGIITNSYAIGAVQGHIGVAGLVGDNSVQIRFSYSTGQVEGSENVAGFTNGGSVFLCFWDTETSGVQGSQGGIGKTTVQMQSASTYPSWGFEEQWVIDEGIDYPRLIWENTPGEPFTDQPRSYGGGTGEPNDPYQIKTAQQLVSIAHYLEDYDKHFVLTNDIDFNTINQSEIIPIGTSGAPFTGTFTGNQHTISNFTYHSDRQQFIGLFGCIGQDGYVENIQLTDVSVTGSKYVGGLAGYNLGTIQRCTITGTINGGNEVGGISGKNRGTIQQCHLSVTVEGRDKVGGLAGFNEGPITECSTSGQVTGRHYIGGLVGQGGYYSNIITYCYTHCEVIGNSSVGGLVGQSRHTDILVCYSNSNVTGRENVGGLVGINGHPMFPPAPRSGRHPGSIPNPPEANISSCYCTGYVEGQEQAGGLVGENGGLIQFCYSASPVINTNPPSNDQASVGGLVGDSNYGVILLSYWDTEISGQFYSAGGKGRTTEQMMTTDTFRGWGYSGEWVIDEGNDYPRLAWEGLGGEFIIDTPNRYSGGTGEPNDPYQIQTVDEFVNLGYHPIDWDKCFVLTNDIDFNDLDPNRILPIPIGVYGVPFTGVFDGNDYTISNFKLLSETEGFIGVFGSIGTGIPYEPYNPAPQKPNDSSSVVNLHLKNVAISAYCCAGGLAGYNHGSISNCSVTGNVAAILKDAGGLFGYNMGEITNCDTECNVTSEQVAGGLIGYNTGAVTACSCNGNVDTYSSCAGGLIGSNYNNVESCHFSGIVTGESETGGLIGTNTGTVIDSSAEGDVAGLRFVGGLVGENEYRKTISRSFSNCIVTGEYQVGGLVGNNGGELLNCYAAGSVDGIEYIGGLTGKNYEAIMFCYSSCTVTGQQRTAGFVGSYGWREITSCFWDKDVSGLTDGVADQDPDPEGILGLSTAQMQVSATFINSGWDFVEVWSICEGTNYPRLAWQIPAGDFVCPDGVGIEDFVFFIEHWRDDNCDLSNDYCDGTDLDFSGTVDEADLEILVENWLESRELVNW